MFSFVHGETINKRSGAGGLLNMRGADKEWWGQLSSFHPLELPCVLAGFLVITSFWTLAAQPGNALTVFNLFTVVVAWTCVDARPKHSIIISSFFLLRFL